MSTEVPSRGSDSIAKLAAAVSQDSVGIWRSERDSVTRFLTSGFFHESVFPKPLSIPLGQFRIFFFRLAKQVEKFAASVVDTGGAP